jgi:hypothetical protein
MQRSRPPNTTDRRGEACSRLAAGGKSLTLGEDGAIRTGGMAARDGIKPSLTVPDVGSLGIGQAAPLLPFQPGVSIFRTTSVCSQLATLCSASRESGRWVREEATRPSLLSMEDFMQKTPAPAALELTKTKIALVVILALALLSAGLVAGLVAVPMLVTGSP